MNDRLITDFYKNVKNRKRTIQDKDDQAFTKIKKIECSKQKNLIESNDITNQLIDFDHTQIHQSSQIETTLINDSIEINQLINKISNDQQNQFFTNSSNHDQIQYNQSNCINPNKDVKLMREIFKQSQYIRQTQFCIQSLHEYMIDFKFNEFYAEFCRNVKCALEKDQANSGTKNILDMISSFLLSVKQKYSIENLKKLNHSSNSNEYESILKKSKHQSNLLNNSNQNLSIENDENRAYDKIEMIKEQSTNKSNQLIRRSSRRTIKSVNKLSNKSFNKLRDKFNENQLNKSFELVEQIYKLYRKLLDFVLNDVLLPYLNAAKTSTRLNVCYLIGKLINSINDLDIGLFDRLKDKLLERLIDKDQKIRSSIAYLLYRFQENEIFNSNDMVKDALCFHLKVDPSPTVRLSCLNVILITKETLPIVISRIRESNSSIRESTFIKLSNKVNFKDQLNKKDRLFLMKHGLNDREQLVINAFVNHVIPAWIKSYEENLIDLLKDLELNSKLDESNLRFIEQFIFNYFDSIFISNRNSKNLSKFYLMIIDFCKISNDEQLIQFENFNNETFFLWSCITKFLKQKEDCLDKKCLNIETRLNLKRQFKLVLNKTLASNQSNIANQTSDENNNQTVNIPPLIDLLDQQKENQTIDLHNFKNQNHTDPSILDLILPKFSKFIDFFRSFCILSLDKNGQNDNFDFEFMFKQLILFLQNYEIVDRSQKSKILKFVEEVLLINNDETSCLIGILLDYVQTNVLIESKELFNFLIDLMHLVEIKLDVSKDFNERSIQRIHEFEMLNTNDNDDLNDNSNQLTDHSNEFIQLLQIFKIAINHIDCIHIIESKIDHYIILGFLSSDSQIRYYALEALSRACFKYRKFSLKFCQLYFALIQKDNSQIKNCALQALIDFVVEYGGEILYCESSSRRKSYCNSREDQANSKNYIENSSNKIQNNQIENEATTSKKDSNLKRLSTTLKLPIAQQYSKEDNGLSINDKYLMNKSQFIEMDSIEQSNAEKEIRKQITKEFIKFLLLFAKSKDEKLCNSSVMGICKLMLLGRIYSPKLLSELILIYFNSNTNQTIIQTICKFLPIYCGVISSSSSLEIKLPNNLTGQHCLFECFMVTIENLYRLEHGEQFNSSFQVEHSNYYDYDIDVLKVIQFMLHLLEPKNHPKMAIEFCEKILEILQIEREDEYQLKESYATKYLIRSLDSFNLLEITDEQKERLRTLIDDIQNENRYEELKKPSISKICKLINKIQINPISSPQENDE